MPKHTDNNYDGNKIFYEYLDAKDFIEQVEEAALEHIYVDVKKEHWYQRVWRPAAAVIFLLVVVFDFVAMPAIIELTNKEQDYAEILTAIERLDNSDIQTEFLRKVDVEKRSWQPLTTLGGGLFFVSFGAILGAAAWTRGMEKMAREQNGGSGINIYGGPNYNRRNRRRHGHRTSYFGGKKPPPAEGGKNGMTEEERRARVEAYLKERAKRPHNQKNNKRPL